ncbi:MAG TPA: radical SAM/SPASM domain-containing protein [Desulfobacterales bacterium]|nr:radical SAM/SPASM domain-containing protein [Desulfobacterales bacterium]
MNKLGGAIALPTSIRLEACSLCQLKCPLCPETQDKTTTIIGRGYLSFETFKMFIGNNPYIRWVELASSGEVFLNPDLPKILEYTHAKKVSTTINDGANLNHASDEALEALVKFQTEVVRCAIDGITQETYSAYRVGGSLKKVIANIRKINAYKEKYRSSKPYLIFQFIVFGHNEHEMEKATLLANLLKMKISFRYNLLPDCMPVKNRGRVRGLIGYVDRRDYLKKTKKDYVRGVCHALWKSPQINWDGKLLGCSNNIRVIFSENVFNGNLLMHYNSEKMRYARQMLMGKAPPRKDMPCLGCQMYEALKKFDNWITTDEIKKWRPPYERLFNE